EGEKYWIEVKDANWIGEKGKRIPAKSITISDGNVFTSLSFSESEFVDGANFTRDSYKALNNIAKVRFQTAIFELKDLVEPTITMIEKLTAPEPDVFSGMSFEEIQTAADRLLSSNGYIDPDSNLGKVVMLIANLAARMKE
ncbi:unnamed protein product, partial [marine sediment metagenome]